MIFNQTTTVRERVLKAFPERQFIHRTGGSVNYFVMSTRAQVFMAIIASFIAVWVLITVFNVVWGQSPLRSASQELKVQKAEFERHLVDARAQESDARALLLDQQYQFELAAKHFEEKHNAIVTMLTQGGVAAPKNDFARPIYAHSEIQMSPTILNIVPRSDRRAYSSDLVLDTGTVLDASLVNLESDQNRILSSGEAKMNETIAKRREILMATGIPMDSILRNSASGVGGPVDDVELVSAPAPGAFLPRLETLKARAREVEMLGIAMKSIPLAHPIDAENYKTSGYGRRKDPFTNRPAMHRGIDLASYNMAPIVTTADGKVSFVGRRNGYGRVVEIDHGHGFKTRYAHLAKTFVKRGQTVEKGEKIAGMGSSGRSTSTHLHYEVMFDKQYQNPETFLRAGKYVQ